MPRTRTLAIKPLKTNPVQIRLYNGDKEVKVMVPNLPHQFTAAESRHLRQRLGGTVRSAATISLKTITLTQKHDGIANVFVVG